MSAIISSKTELLEEKNEPSKSLWQRSMLYESPILTSRQLGRTGVQRMW